MDKKQFTECVNDLWNEVRRLAEHAEQIIYMELKKHGDMNTEFLFGGDEDFIRVWLEDNSWLVYIKRDADHNIVIGLDGNDTGRHESYLIDMNPIDRIEIADFLCRR